MKRTYYVAPSADILGDVELGENVSVWYQAVIRGDIGKIIIGNNSNIQDGCVLHTGIDGMLKVGEEVVVGHNVTLHSCEIGDNTLIGMGSIIMDDVKIGRNCVIGAGTLLTHGKVIPDGTMAFGNPCKIRRELTEEEIQHNQMVAARYVSEAKKQLIEKELK